MNLKKLLLICCLCPLVAMADDDTEPQVSDTTLMGIKVRQRTSNWDYYQPERGFYQRAYSDKSDPRFMIANEDDTFEFGIGGRLRIMGFSDFYGSVNHARFSTWDIYAPSDKAKQFGINVASSNLFFKSRAQIGKRKLISFIELNADEDNEIKLGKAYFSYGGLSVGQTYSFFMDLAAGVQTVDLRGPNTSIDNTHALIGYSSFIGKHWVVDAALERPELQINDYGQMGIASEFQALPDVAARFVYKGDFGHLQLSGLLRQLSYFSVDIPLNQLTINDKGTTKNLLGFGVSFSGKMKFSPKGFFTFQTVYGKGVQQYINDFGSLKMDLLPTRVNKDTPDEYYKMRSVPAVGGYVGAQYNWNKNLVTSAIFGAVKMYLDPVDKMSWISNGYTEFLDNCKMYDYKGSSYLAVNAFYRISDNCSMGVEFLNGMRWQRDRDYNTMMLTGGTKKGYANRFDVMFSYTF